MAAYLEQLDQYSPDFTLGVLLICSNCSASLTRWPHCPYMVKKKQKNLKSSSSEPRKLHVHGLILVYSIENSGSKFVQMMTLGSYFDLFRARSNLYPNAFVWRKIESSVSQNVFI